MERKPSESIPEPYAELTRELPFIGSVTELPITEFDPKEENIDLLEKEKDSMFDEVCAILAQQLHLNPEEIRLDSRIKNDLGADSLDILQLLMTIEEEKGIVIPDEALVGFSTVGDVVAFLEQQDANQPDPFE